MDRVFKTHRSGEFTIVPNEILRDNTLSLRAKGLLSMVFSLPETWNFSVAGLAAICKESEEIVNNTLKELKAAGFLIVDKKMPNETESGRIEYEYNFFDKKQDLEKQGVEKQPLENHPLYKEKNEMKKEESKKDIYIEGKIEKSEEFKDFIEMRRKKGKPLTDRAKAMIIKNLKSLSEDESTQKKILEQSVLYGWSGVYPLKENPEQKTSYSKEKWKLNEDKPIVYERKDKT